ncbi:hypothetical protein CDAR_270501 [Caerostris darwini]|uniref:Uncharacterized protein n=1 Tax=Caerostris darwini TaxID=1538125 RepID=A0AAV4NJP9_9ARAC|nr:hypothetical protein CDAR_270501 [Caerostris darwini]
MSELGNVSVVIETWMHIKALANELKYYKQKTSCLLEVTSCSKMDSDISSISSETNVENETSIEEENAPINLALSNINRGEIQTNLALSNINRGEIQTRRSNEIKMNVLKRAMNTKSDGRVEELALLTEEEYEVIRRITDIGERVAE